MPKTPISKANVYKAPKSSPLAVLADSLASDGPLTTAFTDVPADQINFSVIADNVLRPLRDSVGPSQKIARADAQAVQAEVQAEVQKARKKINSTILNPLKGWGKSWDTWLERERVDKVAMQILPHKDLDVLIVQGVFPFL